MDSIMNDINNYFPQEIKIIIYEKYMDNIRRVNPICNELKQMRNHALYIDSFIWGDYNNEEAEDMMNNEELCISRIGEYWGELSSSILYEISMDHDIE